MRSGDDRRVRYCLLQRLALARRATYEFIDKYEFIAVTDFVTMAYDTGGMVVAITVESATIFYIVYNRLPSFYFITQLV